VASKRESSARKAQFRLEHLDKMLDEALEETFPASDPIAVDVQHSATWPEHTKHYAAEAERDAIK
jgi:hypothetical protein